MLTAQDLKERFQFTYESGIAGSYLVIRGDAGEKLHNYQVDMIASNPREGILPLDVRQKDQSLGFYYNITSRQSLGQFLKRRKIREEEFVRILESMTRTLLEARNYLLRENLFLLDDEFMYVNPNTLDVSLVYLPIQKETGGEQTFKEFLVKLIMFTVDMEEVGNGLLQRILIDAKREAFSIGDLHKLLLDFKCKDISTPNQEGALRVEKKPADILPKQMFASLALPKQDMNKRKEEADKGTKLKIPPIMTPESKEKTETRENKKKEAKAAEKRLQLGYKTPVVPVVVLLQVVIAGILIAAVNSRVLDSLSEDTTTTYGAFALILGAVDFLLLRKLLDPKNRTIVKNPARVVAFPMKKPLKTVPEETNKEKIPPADVGKVEHKEEVAASAEFRDATTLLGFGGSGTVPLEPMSPKPPYLQLEKDGAEEKIILDKPEFVIGRLKDQVDYVVVNNAIGKMHAEFIQRDGMYYIKDLNSRNGTFVNDVRIDSNIEFEVRDKDQIILANSRFLFRDGAAK